jgi:hypothetical protein
MPSIGWQGRLSASSTPDEVVLVCREFLSCWVPADLAELPPSCQPQTPLEWEDINAYALKLIVEMGTGDRVSAPLLYRMSTFFTRAALRLAELVAQPPSGFRRRASDRPAGTD